MLKKIQEKAKDLRRLGYSYREISERLEMAKSTARLWTHNEVVSEVGRKRMNNLIICSQIKARHILLEKQTKYQRELVEQCSVLREQVRYSQDNLKLFLALLYWAEGAKTERRLGFINSDPEMIKIYLKLLRSSFKVKEEKMSALLHLHEYHDRLEMTKFWSEVTGIDKNRISIYNKKNSGLRKKEDYKGCIAIRYGDYRIFDEVMLIIKRFQGLKI